MKLIKNLNKEKSRKISLVINASCLAATKSAICLWRVVVVHHWPAVLILITHQPQTVFSHQSHLLHLFYFLAQKQAFLNGLILKRIEFGIIEYFACNIRISSLMVSRFFMWSSFRIVVNFGEGESNGLFFLENRTQIESTELPN